MEKTGELKAGQSRCDRCSAIAVVVTAGKALCDSCAANKSASDGVALKSFKDELEA